jgi:transcriptional regulator
MDATMRERDPSRMRNALRNASREVRTLVSVYRPTAFDVDDLSTVEEMLSRAPLGHLVVAGDDGFDATPLPLLCRRDGDTIRLVGHVARPNTIWRAAPCEALVILPGPDAYVSPSWYATKAEHGKVVPTWNYEVVHVHGSLLAHDDPAWLAGLVRALTDAHEASLPTPWSIDDPPDGFVDTMLRGIVGVEVVASRVEAKRKLSQNRSSVDRLGAADALGARPLRGAAEIAGQMRAAD